MGKNSNKLEVFVMGLRSIFSKTPIAGSLIPAVLAAVVVGGGGRTPHFDEFFVFLKPYCIANYMKAVIVYVNDLQTQ